MDDATAVSLMISLTLPINTRNIINNVRQKEEEVSVETQCIANDCHDSLHILSSIDMKVSCYW